MPDGGSSCEALLEAGERSGLCMQSMFGCLFESLGVGLDSYIDIVSPMRSLVYSISLCVAAWFSEHISAFSELIQIIMEHSVLENKSVVVQVPTLQKRLAVQHQTPHSTSPPWVSAPTTKSTIDCSTAFLTHCLQTYQCLTNLPLHFSLTDQCSGALLPSSQPISHNTPSMAG